MQFGTRKIRSSGRGSGSVEITLPVDLAVLEGVPCGIELRDGLMPEVVLRLEFGPLTALFEAAWQRLALGFEGVDDIGVFSESDYVLGLFAERGLPGKPCLAYADALVAGQAMERDGTDGEASMRTLEAFARILEAMAAVAGARLDLTPGLAGLLGNQIAFAATGAPVPNLDAFARSALLEVSGETGWCRGDPLSEDRWRAAQADLKRLYLRIAEWNQDDTRLETARDHWYRARRVENRSRATAS